MRPLPEYDRLNDQLEKHLPRRDGKEPLDQSGHSASTTEHDPEIDALVGLARHLQAAPSLQVRSDFAGRLEERMLSHHVALHRHHAAKIRGNWFVSRPLGAYIAMAAMLLCSLLGTSTLTLAARVTNPSHPLYAVKKWEQHLQLSFARSSLDQAAVSQQIAYDRLNTLPSAHGATYHQALRDLDEQMHVIAQTLDALPAGQGRKRLTDELATLKASARRTLRALLPKLSLSERLMTTDELRQLGDAVTQLSEAVIVVSSHSSTEATITLTGKNLSAGGRLLIDHVLRAEGGTLQNGTYIFVVGWSGEVPPQTIGILNTDGTVAQTTVIGLSYAKSDGHAQSPGGRNEKEKPNGNASANTSSDRENRTKQNGASQNENAESTTSSNGRGHGKNG